MKNYPAMAIEAKGGHPEGWPEVYLSRRLGSATLAGSITRTGVGSFTLLLLCVKVPCIRTYTKHRPFTCVTAAQYYS